jgi:hypothetical protein
MEAGELRNSRKQSIAKPNLAAMGMSIRNNAMGADTSKSEAADRAGSRRPLIAFFDYPDVFEDFYPHYGVSQHEFATRWHNTANHAWLAIIQKDIGDVLWYQNSLRPEVDEETHEFTGCRVKFVASSWPTR